MALNKKAKPMRKKIDSSAEAIGEILRKPVSYKVPVNQRDFAWTDEEIDLLWADLTTALSDGRSEYFLGAIVVSPNENDHKVMEIVDGQQRLAALSMIFAAMVQEWRKSGDNARAEEISHEFLGAKDRRTRELVPKLSLNETNNPVFQNVVLGGGKPSAGEKKNWPKSNKLLAGAFDRVKSKLEAWIEEQTDKEEALLELEEYIAGNANAIRIEVGDESDAFVIFETLNDRGLELAVSDLVKNYLFSLADIHLDSFKKSWAEISLLVGSENLTSFLRHLWLSEHEVVRDKELYRNLRNKITSRPSARQFMDRLRKVADYYAALMNPEHTYWADFGPEARKHLDALLLFKVSQFRPLALAVMEGGTPEQVTKMLRQMVVVSFRYTVVSSLSANELERTYSGAALAVRKNDSRNPQAIFKLIKSAYVDDRRFSEDFAARSFSKPQVARYVLIELNNEMERDHAKGAKEETVSLEHILPKNPDTSWTNALPSGADPDEWVEMIGNLTLLEKPVNRGLGNKDFATKNSKGYGPSELAINADVAAQNVWTWKQIEARSQNLAGVARKVWKLGY
jgi:Protein of unknown function DUF262/Protein of unknown function (DUF1524)